MQWRLRPKYEIALKPIARYMDLAMSQPDPPRTRSPPCESSAYRQSLCRYVKSRRVIEPKGAITQNELVVGSKVAPL